MRQSPLWLSILILALSCAPRPPVTAEWPVHGADAASTKFSPLTQLDAENFDDLRIIWRWTAPDERIAPDLAGEEHNRSTPIVVDGVIYFSTPLNVVAAIDAATGQQLWEFDPGSWQGEDFLWGFHRGVSYWEGDDGEARILFGTFDAWFYSLDARTGVPDPAFGDDGRIDMTQGLGRPVDRFVYGNYVPPIISHDIAVVGSTVIDWWAGRPLPSLPPPGDVRGIDVRTGEILWSFHTVPHDGEFGADTWEEAGWELYGAGNVWSQMSADHELGYVYLPTGTISSDYYGGGRPGDNLFGDGIVCVDVRTGKRVWHYQFIHHGLFDYDTPAAPVLVDVVVDGKPIKAVAQVTKQGYCYVFDRVTGEPVWPIVERPAPPSTAPGERPSPTQPHPTKPAAYDRQGLSLDDLIDFTPELRQEAEEMLAEHEYGPLYTPPSERGTIFLPGIVGASNWYGAAADPRTGWLYVPSNTNTALLTLREADETEAPYAYIGSPRPFVRGPRGLPFTKPPYSRITAIDLNTGEHVWMRPVGDGPVNHPAIKHLGLENLGWPALSQFVTVTPNLLLHVNPQPWGRGDFYVDPQQWLTAFSPQTGDILGRTPLPGTGGGNPVTYTADGRQMVLVPMRSAELVALAIPREGEALPQQILDRTDSDHPNFYDAVATLDAGDLAGLRSAVEADPTLLTARGYLDESYEFDYFRGATLLHHVAGNPIRSELPDNVLEITRFLLEAGADPRALTLDDLDVLSLCLTGSQLRWAEISHDMVRLLGGAGADVDRDGGRALFEALTNERDPELAPLLVELGASLDLRYAAGVGRLELVKSFFAPDGQLKPEAITSYRPLRDDVELTREEALAEALGFAAFAGRTEVVAWLLDQGADPNVFTPGFLWPRDRGATALHRAVRGNQVDVVRQLLAAGADPTLKDLNWDSAPGEWAGYFAGPEMAELFEQAQETTEHQ